MEYAEQNIPVLRFESKAEMDSYAEKYVKTPLDFYGNLCEISVVVLPEQYGLLVKLHHIIGDAWSLSLLGTQFNKLLNGDFSRLIPMPIMCRLRKNIFKARGMREIKTSLLSSSKSAMKRHI